MIAEKLHSKPRKLSQTYMVFPEWYIVYAADDLAKVCEKTCASDFPYFKSIFQFWYAYIKIAVLTRKLPFNSQYHGMLIIIGLSFSVEMLIKGLYEKTVGRITWLLSRREQTLEDIFLANLAQEYGVFMHNTPWYKFDFTAWLNKINKIPWKRSIRSFERRLSIKADLKIKALYAKLIGQGVQTPDELELEAIVIDRAGKQQLISLPRYQEFDNALREFQKKYTNFEEIAGNKIICLSAIFTPTSFALPHYVRRLYTLTSLANKNRQRIILELPVRRLIEFMKLMEASPDIQLEKIYDY